MNERETNSDWNLVLKTFGQKPKCPTPAYIDDLKASRHGLKATKAPF